MTPGPDDWRRLIGIALDLLEDADRRGLGRMPFVWGGGTVLMLRLDHRLSRDVDLFVHDAQWLNVLSPRLNEAAERIALDYAEQGSALKIVTAAGDIDVIAAPTVLGDAPELVAVGGREVPADSTAEILVKKLLYRPAFLRPRDVFDLAAVAERDPASARRALDAAWPRRDAIEFRLASLRGAPSGDVVPRPAWTGLPARMFDVVDGFLRETWGA